MSLQSRRELTRSLAKRYRDAKRVDKQRILGEFIAATGYHRKYAIGLLNNPPPLRTEPIQRPRAKRYDQPVQSALVRLWEAAGRVCAKRLVPFLPTLIESLEHHGHLQLPAEVREQLLTISPATADRLLGQIRGARGGISTTRPGALLKQQIALRTFADWDDLQPGFFEADLVAHCGSQNKGSYLNTLVLTDVASGWVECAALLVREQTLVVQALRVIAQRLPILLRGLDTDNGGEFINATLIAYCDQAGITFTRCRPYKKNDQCFVEQKNGAVVRRWIGYDRFEGAAACTLLSQLYERLRGYLNFFQPSLKLLTKTRNGAHLHKTYDAAQTPCQRLLASPDVEETAKAALREQFQHLDPVKLLSQIEELQDALWQQAQFKRPVSTATTSLPGGANGAKTAQTNAGRCDQQTLGSPSHNSVAKPPVPQPTRRQYRRSPSPKQPRTWRTRKDPFAEVWGELQQLLAQQPTITAKMLLNYLQSPYPGQYDQRQLRTLYRRVQAWRRQQALHALEPNHDSGTEKQFGSVDGAQSQ
jgi:hypothetical protein